MPLGAGGLPFAGFLQARVVCQLASTRVSTGSSLSPLDASAATSMYAAALSTAAGVVSRATEPATVKRRMNLGRELHDWLGLLPSPFPNTLQAARPEDLLAFMESQFLSKHGGSRLPGREDLVASPSTVNSSFSHLSTLFESLGRRGPYDPLTGLGNPCDSALVRSYKQGYGRDLWKAGYQELSAVPLTYAKVTHVLDYLDRLSSSSALSPFRQLCLQRDALLVLYCWDSAMRGKEGGQLTLLDLHHPNGSPLFPRGCDPRLLLLSPPPEHLLVLPTHGTKTTLGRSRVRQDPIHLTQKPDPQYCFIHRLWCYLILAHLSGFPMDHFLFRPQTSRRDCFSDTAYSSSSVNQMLQAHLAAIGQYEGETAHGCRRGTLQATVAEAGGGLLGTLAAALQGRIRTPSILQRYLDPHRHLSRYRPY